MKNVIPLEGTRIRESVSVIRSAGGFIVDWDGCCAIDNVLVPEAAEFLRAVQPRLVVLSNNSTNTVEDIHAILRDSGIDLKPDRVLLAGVWAIRHAAARGWKRAMILGSPAMKAYARRCGLEVVREEAQVVIVMRDTRLTYAALERAANCLAGGASVILANPDGSHRGANARIRPETGAIFAALNAAVDLSETSIETIGKPSPDLFLEACRILGTPPAKTVMLGDNPATDIDGARKLGMPALLVAPSPQAFFQLLLETLRNA
ncbi:MAG: HAD-IIA family hydrolase [Hyphomonas sp.]